MPLKTTITVNRARHRRGRTATLPCRIQDRFIAISAGMSFVDSQETIYGGLPEKRDA